MVLELGDAVSVGREGGKGVGEKTKNRKAGGLVVVGFQWKRKEKTQKKGNGLVNYRPTFRTKTGPDQPGG